MTVKDIFELAINLGIENDLRGRRKVEKNLEFLKSQFEKLEEEKKHEFDQDKLINPYADSRIHNDDGRQVRKVLVGIDIDTAELLVAKHLGDIDLVIAHHPLGKGLSNLDEVMKMQAEVLADYGVPINIAQGLLKERIQEVSRGINSANHFKTVDAAKNLGLNLINVHTPADNLVASFLKKNIEEQQFTFVSEILKALKDIPEYRQAMDSAVGPTLFAGSPENYCGKVAITEITGGTEGAPEIYEKLAIAQVGTVVGMHMSEKHQKEAQKAHINAIIAGHMSSDSLGMNLFVDELEKNKIEVVSAAGFMRFSRI